MVLLLFMVVKIGTSTEIRKIHSCNRLLEQSVLSLAEGRLDWERACNRTAGKTTEMCIKDEEKVPVYTLSSL